MRTGRTTSPIFFAVFCLCLLLSGCLSSEEQVGEPKWTATITPILETGEESTPVVANIGIIEDLSGQAVFFTEPLEGTFSVAPLTSCDSECSFESYNMTDESSFAPVRISEGAVGENDTNVWIISDIGILYPSNEKQGRVVLFDYRTQQSTTAIDGIGRTVCAEPGDFDGDGDVDLTLCEFGHDEGTVSWLENEDDSDNWTQHILDPRPGSIHAMPVDIDGDDDRGDDDENGDNDDAADVGDNGGTDGNGDIMVVVMVMTIMMVTATMVIMLIMVILVMVMRMTTLMIIMIMMIMVVMVIMVMVMAMAIMPILVIMMIIVIVVTLMITVVMMVMSIVVIMVSMAMVVNIPAQLAKFKNLVHERKHKILKRCSTKDCSKSAQWHT